MHPVLFDVFFFSQSLCGYLLLFTQRLTGQDLSHWTCRFPTAVYLPHWNHYPQNLSPQMRNSICLPLLFMGHFLWMLFASNEGWGWDGAEVKGKSVHGVHCCKLDNGIAKESMGIDAGKETRNESSSYSLKYQEYQLPFCFREWSSLLRPLGDLKERVVLTSVETFSPLQGSGARRRFTCFLPQNSNVQAWKLWSFSRYSPAFACYSWRAFLLLISMYTKESK